MARKMKDSGIEWIGEIPEGWTCKRGKQLFVETNERSKTGSEELLTVSHLTGVTPRSQKNVNMFMSESLVDYKVCHPGDLAANTMWMWQGAIGVSRFHGVISPSYNTYRQRTINYIPEYLDYLLRIRPLVDTYNAYSTGITLSRLRLYPQSFLSIHFIVPPMDEQQKIATYLDVECSRIDAMLAKTRDSIEEYKKLKQAVITQAVTKGVRGEREMKDSGVAWIGEIPKDWEIKRLKSFCTIVDCKNRTPDVFPDGKYTVVRTTCIKDCSFSYEGSYQTDTTNFKAWTLKGQPHKGDIFFTREAPVGEACLVPNADNLCMGQRVMFFRPEDNSDARYIMYSIYGPLVREYIASKNSGSTVGHLKLGQVACIPIFYCPPLEQKEIADYLDAKCAEIDGLIAKKEQLVKELESYKKSLIYEVVTGKREV